MQNACLFMFYWHLSFPLCSPPSPPQHVLDSCCIACHCAFLVLLGLIVTMTTSCNYGNTTVFTAIQLIHFKYLRWKLTWMHGCTMWWICNGFLYGFMDWLLVDFSLTQQQNDNNNYYYYICLLCIWLDIIWKYSTLFLGLSCGGQMDATLDGLSDHWKYSMHGDLDSLNCVNIWQPACTKPGCYWYRCSPGCLDHKRHISLPSRSTTCSSTHSLLSSPSHSLSPWHHVLLHVSNHHRNYSSQ